MNQFNRSFLKYIFPFSFFIFLYFISCNRDEKSNSKPEHYASLDDSTGYVGIETCKKCHADKYETFIHTGMGMSFDKASRKKSSAIFSGHDIIHDKFLNLEYYPHWENDSLVITEFRMDKKDTVYKRNEKISWIIGSGQHTNSHLINVNGYVYQAPATFYTQKGQWDLPPGFENGFNSRFSRMIGLECMTCHNAYPKMIPGSENKYSFVANGIDCERCHGPGSKHVREKLAGDIIDVKNKIDYSIVNPAKLPISLQLDVCQRCHIQGNAVLKEGKSFLDFRPGMHLSDVMNVYMPLYKGDDASHIMASHAERMKMSQCFIITSAKAGMINKDHPSLEPYKNAMTCVTCHDPHVSVRATDKSVFNDKCKACHHSGNEGSNALNQSASKLICTESVSVRKETGDNCVSCHMPKNGTIDIPHVTTTDHWIRVPVKQKEINKIKEFAGLVCINNPLAGDKSKGIAFLSYYEKFSANPAFLDSAKRYFDDGSKDSVKVNFKYLVRWAFLKDDYNKVIEYVNMNDSAMTALKTRSFTNDDAWTAYRIGESYNSEGDKENAVLFFQRAADLAPYQLDFRNKLAEAQDETGHEEDARGNFEFILNENPKYASAYVNLGYLVLKTEKNVTIAERMYDEALALNPDDVQAYLNKAGLKLFLGKTKEACFYLREVLKRDKYNIKAKVLLSRLSK